MNNFYNILDRHWLWKEVRSKLHLSNPAYTYWPNTKHIKLNRYVFLEKETLPEKYLHVEPILTDLSGFLPTQYASQQLTTDAHIFNTKQMRLYSKFEYKFVDNIKFVNIKRFFLEHGIYVKKNSLIQLAKLKDLDISEECRFYRIDDDYGVVVYD
ncbi:MAG: hypothetical protein U9P71_08315 [Campylobacterota bacterium]|nr:hypothetical protein [Campylobacterota bacterium]